MTVIARVGRSGVPAFFANVVIALLAFASALWSAFGSGIEPAANSLLFVLVVVLFAAVVIALLEGCWFAPIIALILRVSPEALEDDLDSQSSVAVPGGAATAFLAFYRDLFVYYVRLEALHDPRAWAGRIAFMSSLLLYLYIDVQGMVYLSAFVLRSSASGSDPSGTAGHALSMLAGTMNTVSLAAVLLGFSFAVASAVGLFFVGARALREEERALLTLVYVLADVVWFTLLYHGGSVVGWASFRVVQGDVERVANLSAIDLAYLVLGVLTTAGSAGVTPANLFARASVALQVLTVFLLLIWIANSVRVLPLIGNRGRSGEPSSED